MTTGTALWRIFKWFMLIQLGVFVLSVVLGALTR